METVDRPEDIGLSQPGMDRLYTYMQGLVDSDRVVGAAVGVARHGVMLAPSGFGRMNPASDAPPVRPDTIFLLASITKPVTCSAIGLLIQERHFDLDTPVASLIPEFGQNGKAHVRVRHLLTHTSGLPDMIPENIAYRKRFAPLEDFLNRIYQLELQFEPGTQIQYQSAGIAVLGEIVRRATGLPLPQYLKLVFFRTFSMKDTALGGDGIDFERVAHVRVSPELDEEPWTWNKPYWRAFGAPWGGMFSTVRDINIFCQMFLLGGVMDDLRVLDASTTDLMTQNHTSAMPAIPQASKARQSWGLGWQINDPRTTFGVAALPSAQTFGHSGATGTIAWADPVSGLSCAILTSQPDMCESADIRRCTDHIVAADLRP